MPSLQTTIAMPSDARKTLRITVLAGGPSAEREISLASGQAVAEALRRNGHDVLLADITPDDLSALERPADVVFPALHGTFGEDGTLQKIMEQRGLRFVGSGSRASATAMDKVATKRAVQELGVPTPAYEVVTAGVRPALAPPVIVKPVAQGSSVATTIVNDREILQETVDEVAASFGAALVEQFIPGAELTVGFLGDQPLPPICVRPKRRFYDYDAKYRDANTDYLFETSLSSALLEKTSKLSQRVFEALGCRHLARIDWIIGQDETPFFLEVNTIPGFTRHSLVPKAAAHIGIAFDELVDRLVRMALEG